MRLQIAEGALDDALDAVQGALPGVSEEAQAQLAVEVFKASLVAERLADISRALDRLTSC
ncbi:MAG: hypothetical protein WDA10_08885 [Porticoccaceae bacterium]